MKGVKKGAVIVLDTEPMIPDGTEVDIVLPTEWEAQRKSLLSVGYYPDFGTDSDKVRQEWKPEKF